MTNPVMAMAVSCKLFCGTLSRKLKPLNIQTLLLHPDDKDLADAILNRSGQQCIATLHLHGGRELMIRLADEGLGWWTKGGVRCV